jgi:hypothetical protein
MFHAVLRKYTYSQLSINEAIDICNMKINSLPFKIDVILSAGLIRGRSPRPLYLGRRSELNGTLYPVFNGHNKIIDG